MGRGFLEGTSSTIPYVDSRFITTNPLIIDFQKGEKDSLTVPRVFYSVTSKDSQTQPTCPHCYSEISNTDKFCPHCGKTLQETCPYCNPTNKPGAKFCTTCGNNLRESQADTTNKDSKGQGNS